MPMIYPQRPGEIVCDVCNIAAFLDIQFIFYAWFIVLILELLVLFLICVLQFYMKTGSCKYAQNCKFHHPFDRSAPHSKENEDTQQPVALTLAGLPRREVTC
jgi:hypothetical protein